MAAAISGSVVELPGELDQVEWTSARAGCRTFCSLASPILPPRKPEDGYAAPSEIAARYLQTGVATVVAGSILDEGAILALAEAADLLEVKP